MAILRQGSRLLGVKLDLTNIQVSKRFMVAIDFIQESQITIYSKKVLG